MLDVSLAYESGEKAGMKVQEESLIFAIIVRLSTDFYFHDIYYFGKAAA